MDAELQTKFAFAADSHAVSTPQLCLQTMLKYALEQASMAMLASLHKELHVQ